MRTSHLPLMVLASAVMCGSDGIDGIDSARSLESWHEPTPAPTMAPTRAPTKAHVTTPWPSASPRPTHRVGAAAAPTHDYQMGTNPYQYSRTKKIKSNTDDAEPFSSGWTRLWWIIAAMAFGAFCLKFPPARNRLDYVIEILSGAHGVGINYREKRQAYYRSKYSEKDDKAKDSLLPTTGTYQDETYQADQNPFTDDNTDDDDTLVI